MAPKGFFKKLDLDDEEIEIRNQDPYIQVIVD